MLSKHRIAIMAPSLLGGGAERTMLHLATGLHERGHEVDLLLRDLVCDYPDEVPIGVRIFFLSRRKDAEYRKTLERLPVAPLPLVQDSSLRFRFPRFALSGVVRMTQWPLLMSKSLPRWAAAVATYLDRECPNVLLASQVGSVAAGMMAVRLAHRHIRTVAVLHSVLATRRDRRRSRCSFPYADAAVGVSRGVADQLIRIPRVSGDRVHTIYDPVVPPNLRLKIREPANHAWFNDDGVPVILAIGRLTPVKDFPCLLAAFARVLGRRPARLMVLGKGKLQETLLSRARQLGIAENVAFPGFVENPYAFLAKASLFVLSSRYEGLSRVLIEAMACGCPVVSTNCQFGPNEILEDGRWGELVPVGNATALADAIIRTLDAPPMRDDLQKRASYFSIERAVGSYEALLLNDSR